MTKLPLPSPRSSSELDKKILAYAKQQLPEKKPYRPPLWLSGMATASVIAIAILIAIPDQPPALPAPPRSAATKEPAKKVEMLMQQSARKQSAPLAASAALYAEQEMAASDSMQMPISILDTVTIQQQLQEMDSLVKRGDSKQAALEYQEMKKTLPAL